MEINKSKTELEEAIRSLKENINTEKNAIEKAKLYITLGNTYVLMSEQREQRENLMNALVSFDEAEKLQDSPEIVEIVENMKGFIFFKMAFIEDRNDNLYRSIEHYKKALQYRTKDKDSYKYASTKYNLGNTYLSLRDGKERENIVQSIKEFKDAYDVRKDNENSVEFGVINNALGLSYLMLSEIAKDPKETASFLMNALSYFDAASKLFTIDKYPIDYAMIHNNIGVCFTKLAVLGIDKEKNLKEGIKHYKLTLNVYTKNDFIEDFGTAMYNIGIAYHNLSKVVSMPAKSEYLKEAEKYIKDSVDTLDVDIYKDAFARGNYNLGMIYKDFTELYKKDEFIEKELAAFTDSLRGFSIDEQPFAFSTAHFYIAQALYAAGNKDQAIKHYKTAKGVAEKFDKKLAEDLEKIINQIESLK